MARVQSIKFKQRSLGGIRAGVASDWISARLHKSIRCLLGEKFEETLSGCSAAAPRSGVSGRGPSDGNETMRTSEQEERRGERRGVACSTAPLLRTPNLSPVIVKLWRVSCEDAISPPPSKTARFIDGQAFLRRALGLPWR
ncbi:hypothetical protein MHYP_G00359290 [Metynnis hypsauchen]